MDYRLKIYSEEHLPEGQVERRPENLVLDASVLDQETAAYVVGGLMHFDTDREFHAVLTAPDGNSYHEVICIMAGGGFEVKWEDD